MSVLAEGSGKGSVRGLRWQVLLLAAALALAGLAGCATAPGFPVPMGERVACGGITYRVVGARWTHLLRTEGGGKAVPTHDFLLVSLEMTNSGEANLPALWLPELWAIDEHYETWPLSPVTPRLKEGLRPSQAVWRPTQSIEGVAVFDVPQALYHLQPEGCPRLDLRSWWPERFGD